MKPASKAKPVPLDLSSSLKTIDDMNARYFMVEVGRQSVIAEEDLQQVGGRRWTDYIFRSKQEFKDKLAKVRIHVPGEKPGSVKTRPLAEVWIEHDQGLQYDHLVYVPEGSDMEIGANDFNGWKGFTVEPAEGSWSLVKQFIYEIVCDRDDTHFQWVLDWMAALFQKPGQRGNTALACLGTEGCGKNFFADAVLGWCFDGRHSLTTTHTNQVLGEFNSILSGRCFLVLDEVGLRTDKEASAMKGLITGFELTINRKNIDAAREPSMLHVIFLSNDIKAPLKISTKDRRIEFLQFSDDHVDDIPYFEALARELDEQGGRAAMLYDLLQRPVNWNRQRKALDSAAKRLIKRQSWSPEQSFFYQLVQKVKPEDWANAPKSPGIRHLNKAATATEYRQFLDDAKVRKEVLDPRGDLHQALKELLPLGFDFNKPVRSGKVLSRDFWTLPPYQTFCQSLAKALGCTVEELDQTTVQLPIEDSDAE